MIYAFIPARSGSTRLKNKNIKKINNRPLIYYTVLVAIKSKYIDKVIFSSDSKKYYNNLCKYLLQDGISLNKLIFDHREKKFSTSKYKIFDYFKILFLDFKKFTKKDLIIQLLPTSPLRSLNTLNKVIEYSLKNEVNIFTACEYDFHVSFSFNIIGSKWKSLFKNNPMISGNTRGQDQKNYYHPNGSIYTVHLSKLKKRQRTFYEGAEAYIMNRIESIDIDDKHDFKFVSFLLK